MGDLPDLDVIDDDPLSRQVDVLAVPVFRGAFEGPATEEVLRALGLDGPPREHGFTGRRGETLVLAAPGMAARRVCLVGLGRMDELDEATLRRAAGACVRRLADDVETIHLALALALPTTAAVRAVAEGGLLGAYRFLDYRSDPPDTRVRRIEIAAPSAVGDGDTAIRLAAVTARAVVLARDLVNTPALDLGPSDLAERAAAAVGDDVEVEIWDERRLRDERCGGVLAVGQGSARPPRMLVLRRRATDPAASVALVGKGITFDTGGLSLKRPSSIMETMKYDMAGAAAVVATFAVLDDVDPAVDVLGVCALADNAPSGDAQRPGDIIRTRSGRTVAVVNTDAEGRLVLADALDVAVEQDPDAVVDLATLTGAAAHAVGGRAIAVLGDDERLVEQLLGAARQAGEPAWRLPLWADLRENLDDEVADIDNLGRGDKGGAIIGGLFLQEFVTGAPWCHLDIAPAAWAGEARDHLAPGGTGAGVATLLRWLEQFTAR